MHIDYLTLSDKNAVLRTESDVIAQFDLMLHYNLDVLFRVQGGYWGGGRAPYKHSYRVFGASLFFSLNRAGCILELTGLGCNALRDYLPALVDLYPVTRIDIAHDIHTHLLPLDLTAKKPSAQFDTVTGQTVYLGSMKSDTMTRIYRYAPPHPRSEDLRIEHVFRRSYAQKVASDYSKRGIQGLIDNFMTRCEKQKIGHDSLNFSFDRVTYSAGDRKQNGGVTWYKRQVVPALKKMLQHGLLTKDDIRKDIL